MRLRERCTIPDAGSDCASLCLNRMCAVFVGLRRCLCVHMGVAIKRNDPVTGSECVDWVCLKPQAVYRARGGRWQAIESVARRRCERIRLQARDSGGTLGPSPFPRATQSAALPVYRQRSTKREMTTESNPFRTPAAAPNSAALAAAAVGVGEIPIGCDCMGACVRACSRACIPNARECWVGE
jgi:hypothetical protein